MQRASQSGDAYVSGYLRQPLRSLDDALAAHADARHLWPSPRAPEPARPVREERRRTVLPPRRDAAPPALGRRLAELEARQRWLAGSGNELAARAVANEMAALAATLGAPAPASGGARQRQPDARRLKVAC